MKFFIKYKNLFKLIVIFLISFLISVLFLNYNYKKNNEKFLENGDVPESVFNIVEYDGNKNEYKKISFEGKNLFENLKEYLENNGNKKLFLPKDYYYENDDIIEKYSIVEKTKEYETVEIYNEIPDWAITFQYKVYYNGDVVPYYLFDNHFSQNTGIYMLASIIAVIVTLFINFLFIFALNHFKRLKELKNNPK